MKRLIARFTGLTGARIVGASCMFAVTLVLARVYGPEAVAEFAIAVAAASVLAVIAPLGFHAIAPVVISGYAANIKNGLIAGDARDSLVHTSVLAGLAAIVLAVMASGVGGLVFDLPVGVIAGIAALTPALSLLLLQRGILTGLQQQFAAQIPDTLARPMLTLALLGAAAVLVAGETQVNWAEVAVAVSAWVAVIVQHVFLRRAITALECGECRTERKRWWRMAPPWLSISLLWDYFIELHLLLAALIAAPLEVALLHVCFVSGFWQALACGRSIP